MDFKSNNSNHRTLEDPLTITSHLEELKAEKPSANLIQVQETIEKLKKMKSKEIQFARPVLTQGDNAVIFPNTINVIQGQAGVHKSRLAENICSAFLKRHDCHNEILGFKRTNFDSTHTVVYVDTERNINDQFPAALQQIQVNAGFNKEDHPENFRYLSLIQVDRKVRFETLREYILWLKKQGTGELVIVLDVSTDCIVDFNQTACSMELIDMMNVMINEFEVVFLCLIHENPNSDKARGHFGTELKNKASTLIQVGFEKDSQNNDTDLIRVKYLKCRSTAKHSPFYIKYSKELRGLVLADEGDIRDSVNMRRSKAAREDLLEAIERYLGNGEEMAKEELLLKLSKDFELCTRTLRERLKEIENENPPLTNDASEPCKLVSFKKGKPVYIRLEKVKQTVEGDLDF